jgi:hypothetical protein
MEMEQVRLGRSGLLVSKIGFGGIPIQRLSPPEAVRVIHRALELGIDWLDTAHGYGPSEEMIGQAVRSWNRSRVRVFTKAQGKNPADLGRQVETSFRRLGLPAIDLYQLHLVAGPQEWGSLQGNGTLDLLLGLKAEGRIGHIGASAHTRLAALAVIEHPAIEVLQYPFNLLEEKEGLEVLEACRARGVGFIAMKPFGGGMLDNAPACIRFLMQFPDVATDPGFETIREVEEVAALAAGPAGMTGGDRAAAHRLRRELGDRFCHRCGYCLPCPQEVSIVTLMTMDTLLKRFPVEKRLNDWPEKAARTAALCNECGACEERCPYRLPIRIRIQEGAAAFRRATGT